MNPNILIHLAAFAAAGYILYRYTLQYSAYLRETEEAKLVLSRRKDDKERRQRRLALAERVRNAAS